jgi:hypothetical protein
MGLSPFEHFGASVFNRKDDTFLPLVLSKVDTKFRAASMQIVHGTREARHSARPVIILQVL